jgi:hypothetical protein
LRGLFAEKVGTDRSKAVVTEGVFYNVYKPVHVSQSKLVWSEIRPRPPTLCGFAFSVSETNPYMAVLIGLVWFKPFS